jgi:5-enolpyruvylshikimate-3-phosphate synthase
MILAVAVQPRSLREVRRDEDHFDERLWTYGSVIALLIAAVAIIGGVTWVFHGDHQTASRPQTPVTETTGQRQ